MATCAARANVRASLTRSSPHATTRGSDAGSAASSTLFNALRSIAFVVIVCFSSALAAEDILVEDFETGAAFWGVQGGVWEVGEPSAGPAACEAGRCVGTVLGGNYPADTDARFEYLWNITLPAVESPEQIELRLSHWFNYSTNDAGHVQIQIWDETEGWSDWQTVYSIAGDGSEWTELAVDLSAWAERDIRLGFRHEAVRFNEAAGWFIDDIRIRTVVPEFTGSFESGWGSWSASNGVWQVDADDCGQGRGCITTRRDRNYAADTDSRMEGAPLRLEQIGAGEQIELRLSHWFEYSTNDAGQVHIQVWDETAGWSDWQAIHSIAGVGSEWTELAINLSAWAGRKIRLGFWHEAARYDQAAGWFIDNIQIRTVVPEFTGSFESGWGSWTASNGVWQVDADDCGQGRGCIATRRDGNYAADTDSRMEGAPLRLEQIGAGEQIELRLSHWFEYSTNDAGHVQIQTWDQAEGWSDWQTVYSIAGEGSDWTELAIDLSAWSGRDIRLGFRHEAVRFNEAAGWFIDDIRIRTVVPGFTGSFESGWGSWSASNGVWQVDVDDCGRGRGCIATRREGNYRADTDSRMVGAPLWLGEVGTGEQIELRLSHWFHYSTNDAGQVQIQVWDETAGWSDWQAIHSIAGVGSEWTELAINLSAWAGRKIRLGFWHEAARYDQAAGWFIDNIQIRTVVPEFTGSFESGWGSWTASNGVWQVDADDCGQGRGCIATRRDGNYAADTDSRMEGAPLRLEQIGAGEQLALRLSHWFEYSTNDSGHVQIQTWDTTEGWSDWQTIYSITGEGSDWTELAVDLSAWAGRDVRLGFWHEAVRSNEAAGWFIDNIRVERWPSAIASDVEGDFENGWGRWSSSNAVWQIGTPVSGPGGCSGGLGCAGTRLAGNYPPDTDSRIVYAPRLRLPRVIGPRDIILRFSHWFSYASGDSGAVQVSTFDEDGATWSDWTRVGEIVQGQSSQWTTTFVRLTEYKGEWVRLGFWHEAARFNEAAGWFIDNVEILGLSETPRARNDQAYTNQGEPVAIDVRFNDTDPNFDALRISAVGTPRHGEAATDGVVVTYQPTRDYVGWDEFTYTVTDDQHGSHTALVRVAVGPVAPPNRPPAISANPPGLVAPGELYRYSVRATDPDGDALSYRIEGQPSWADFDADEGTLSGTPTQSDIGSYTGIRITVADGDLAAATDVFDITVAQPPVISIDSPMDGELLNQLFEVHGRAAGPSSPVSLVRLQITDGDNFLRRLPHDNVLELSPGTEAWIVPARGEASWADWRFNVSTISWTPGVNYTITAQVIDELGQQSKSTAGASFTEQNRRRVQGSVTTADGTPVPDVEVVFVGDDRVDIKTVADGNGGYSQMLTLGWSGEIEVSKRGYAFEPDRQQLGPLTQPTTVDFEGEAVPSARDARAIIVAGGGNPIDPLWPATNASANFAYRALRIRGLDAGNIRYFNVSTSEDADGDGASDVYAAPTRASLENAILDWAGSHVSPDRPLIVYLVDHGLPNQYLLHNAPGGIREKLTAATLDGWLDELQERTGARVLVIYDACYAGSFMDDLQPPLNATRVSVFSAEADELAYFGAGGDMSFSAYFWSKIIGGESVRDAFLSARQGMRWATNKNLNNDGQNAVLDDNGDGFFTKQDGILARRTYIGDDLVAAPPPLRIVSTSGDQVLAFPGLLNVHATVDRDPDQVLEVRAVGVPPSAGLEGVDPVTDLPHTLLVYNATSGQYEGSMRLREPGVHRLTIFAQPLDPNLPWSEPAVHEITVVGTLPGDLDEPDDRQDTARLVPVNGLVRQRQFHDDGDVDWVRFVVERGRDYRVVASSAGDDADLVLELFGAEGDLLRTVDNTALGEDETLSWVAQATGTVSVRITNRHGGFGSGTAYALNIVDPARGPGEVALSVTQSYPSTDVVEGASAPFEVVLEAANSNVAVESLTVLPEGAVLTGALPDQCLEDRRIIRCSADLIATEARRFSFDLSFSTPGMKSLTTTLAARNGAGELLPDSQPADNVHELEVLVTAAEAPARLRNISTRGWIGGGDNVLIGGIIISGTEPKDVLLRGRGPSLASFLDTPVADPKLELYSGATLVSANDDWMEDPRSDEIPSELTPTHLMDSVMVVTLDPGAYTAIVRGHDDAEGIGIVEAFELADTGAVRLQNISTRGYVGVDTDDTVLIGGIIVTGNRAKDVVVRARGPSLGEFGVSETLIDPNVSVFADQQMIDSNEDWMDHPRALEIPEALRPTSASEAAIRLTLEPGAYTAIVRGAPGDLGVGIVEVFEVP